MIFFFLVSGILVSRAGEVIAQPFLPPTPPPHHMAAHFSKKMKKVFFFFFRGAREYVIFNQSRAAGRHLNNNMKIDESLPPLAGAHRKAITATALLIIWTERRVLTHCVFLLHHHSPGKCFGTCCPSSLLSMSGEGNLICKHVFLSSGRLKANKYCFRPPRWGKKDRRKEGGS